MRLAAGGGATLPSGKDENIAGAIRAAPFAFHFFVSGTFSPSSPGSSPSLQWTCDTLTACSCLLVSELNLESGDSFCFYLLNHLSHTFKWTKIKTDFKLMASWKTSRKKVVSGNLLDNGLESGVAASLLSDSTVKDSPRL